MFPVTDSSQTIIDCLLSAAQSAGVRLHTQCGVDRVERSPTGGFSLQFSTGGTASVDKLLIATGGCRSTQGGALAASLGHSLELPVPSLFTFDAAETWLRELPGVSMDDVIVSVPKTKLKERGPVLITHRGVSGPSVLRLSAWGARALHDLEYKFPLQIQWLPDAKEQVLTASLAANRLDHPSRKIVNSPIHPIPTRLWEALTASAGIDAEMRWGRLPRAAHFALVQGLLRTTLAINGKSLNKDEFVTCGGVPLSEIDFKTMESRICPNLHFAGEVLDIDGITGGFNFQAAWTTGWIAGRAMGGGPA